MSVGFFGIQFGWGLQMGNMSSIYEYLGANESELPLLWLAAPLTGLIVQPIIGHMSDNTWCFLGRRRPYFLVGAIFSSIALILMPQSSALWMAAGLLWVLDASVNISMEPFRAFVADLLPERQRTVGFAMQSVFIGAGAVIASKLPGWLEASGVGSTTSQADPIPQTVHVAFTTGAVVFFLAVLWTVLTTREHPPETTNEEADKDSTTQRSGPAEIWDAFRNMPSRMKHLAAVQFLTWMGLFCMWIFFTVAVARDILGATDTQSDLYKQGIYLANDCFATYNMVAFFTAIGFLWIGRFVSAKWLHVVSLACGGIGLSSVLIVRDPTLLTWGSFVGVGIAWASILSMPYAMLSGALPEKRIGVYMGIFNLFIVIPQILVAIILSRVLANSEDISRLHVVTFGGVCLLVAAIITAFIPYRPNFQVLESDVSDPLSLESAT
ncbi:maltose/moltooligosaccharide transporter [Rhodopirellula rubra]|uniref:Maltose/moltooligosaccharide transporter n=1 Tax=Aporhodopirellula rubra TaxID=980271 RepID=A0A7W5E3Q9_9BACT|nr:MFS transporter [Aporhodopirellula rubra]MBB3209209.1 maltose/moltooligosaccharide transporter [Aporhodopirellula rubra]